MGITSRRRAALVAIAILLAACSDPGTEPVPQMEITTPTPTFVTTVGGGTSQTLVITQTNRSTTPVQMEVSGLPAGASASFSPNPLPPTTAAATFFVITTPEGTAPGAYTIVLRARGTMIGDARREFPLTVLRGR